MVIERKDSKQIVKDSNEIENQITFQYETFINKDRERQSFRKSQADYVDEFSQYDNRKRYKVIHALDDRLHYSGRFLKGCGDTPTLSANKKQLKITQECVEFDWAYCSISIKVSHTNFVVMKLKGEGNYFNVFVDDTFHCILHANKKASYYEVVNDLTRESHIITIYKRTEPVTRGALRTFKVCSFYAFIVDEAAQIYRYRKTYSHKLEFIGDATTCGFGNEGERTSSMDLFQMKGRLENAYNSYSAITARVFNSEAHLIAWSGKGVLSNAGEWGCNMRDIWKRTLASREGDWDLSSWVPDAVVILIGWNDMQPPKSPESLIIDAYCDLLHSIRQYRPDAHVFCLVCDEGCISSENTLEERRIASQQLQEMTKLAIAKFGSHDEQIHYFCINVPGNLKDEDYATMMNHSVSGHQKIADAVALEISSKMGWKIAFQQDTTPYPLVKKVVKGSNPIWNSPYCLLQ